MMCYRQSIMLVCKLNIKTTCPWTPWNDHMVTKVTLPVAMSSKHRPHEKLICQAILQILYTNDINVSFVQNTFRNSAKIHIITYIHIDICITYKTHTDTLHVIIIPGGSICAEKLWAPPVVKAIFGRPIFTPRGKFLQLGVPEIDFGYPKSIWDAQNRFWSLKSCFWREETPAATATSLSRLGSGILGQILSKCSSPRAAVQKRWIQPPTQISWFHPPGVNYDMQSNECVKNVESGTYKNQGIYPQTHPPLYPSVGNVTCPHTTYTSAPVVIWHATTPPISERWNNAVQYVI